MFKITKRLLSRCTFKGAVSVILGDLHAKMVKPNSQWHSEKLCIAYKMKGIESFEQNQIFKPQYL